MFCELHLDFVSQLIICLLLLAGCCTRYSGSSRCIKSPHPWLDMEHIEEGIQNILVCIEMVAVSVIQRYACSVEPYSGQVNIWKLKKDE